MPPRTPGTHTWNIGHISPQKECHIKHVLEQWVGREVEIVKLIDNEVEYEIRITSL